MSTRRYPSFPDLRRDTDGQGTYPPRNWSRSPAGIVHTGEPLEHANVLQRLAQALDRVSAELRELVKGTAPRGARAFGYVPGWP
jgi:hypothetical protein